MNTAHITQDGARQDFHWGREYQKATYVAGNVTKIYCNLLDTESCENIRQTS